MPFVAIIGAGPLGGALTYTLASRNRFDEVRLVDPAGSVAEGKALDVRQSGPPDGWSARVSGHAALDAAKGAWVVVLADVAGDPTTALRTVLPAVPGATLVCADVAHGTLLSSLVGAGLASPDAVVGSAPLAARGAACALLAAACDVGHADIGVSLDPASGGIGFHIDWARTSIWGEPAESVLPRERRSQLADLFARAWPPGPLSLASAAARVAEAAWFGARAALPLWVPDRRAERDRTGRLRPSASTVSAQAIGPFLVDVRFAAGGRLWRSTNTR